MTDQPDTPTPVHSLTQRVRYNTEGLAPAIIQDAVSREVLMLGWMNEESLTRTLKEGRVTFWSRSRQEYWRKGDTSGHRQYVERVSLDCDEDTILIQVHQIGAACHTGSRTCFDAREIPSHVIPQHER